MGCYVHNNRLSAISQYNCYCKFDCLQDEEHILKVRDAIQDYHNDILSSFTIPSYVMDIAVNPEDYSCTLIELNPFGKHMSSGSALFHWLKDEDLMYGKLNLENPPIRILKQLV